MPESKFKYFVLLASMRTGSNLFEQSINQFKGYRCYGELFNPNFIGHLDQESDLKISLQDRERDPLKLIEKMIINTKDQCPGFRLFPGHDRRILDHVLRDQDCAKIILTRNLLDTYISYEIAQKTDQWKLTDFRFRKEVKIHFDLIAFKKYAYEITSSIKEYREILQETGQTAFYISFEDLGRLDVFNGLSHHLGSDERLDVLKDPLKRQNPQVLKEKVENYDEMINQIRSVNFLNVDIPEFFEPERHVAAKKLIFCDNPPLLFQPVTEYGKQIFKNWLQAHSDRLCGHVMVSPNQKQVFDWLQTTPGHVVFTFLAHPVERVFYAFNTHIFHTGDKCFPWIRKTLVEHYNLQLPSPEPSEVLDENYLDIIGYGLNDYRRDLKKFTRFLIGNLKGQTRARIDHAWASQTAILEGYTKITHPDYVLRGKTYKTLLETIETQLELPHIPAEAIELGKTIFDLADIYDEELERLTAKAYQRDYVNFGFNPWRI